MTLTFDIIGVFEYQNKPIFGLFFTKQKLSLEKKENLMFENNTLTQTIYQCDYIIVQESLNSFNEQLKIFLTQTLRAYLPS